MRHFLVQGAIGREPDFTFADRALTRTGISALSHKIFGVFLGNFSVTLTPWSHLLRLSFQFELSCSLLRQSAHTKREQGPDTVNETLRKPLIGGLNPRFTVLNS
jgi:hypothetical protein